MTDPAAIFDAQAELQALDAQLKTILPAEYQECYEDVRPVSMGSAGLKYDAAGKVAWDEIWGSFCDLAMAGGPPHKGTLLEPASEVAILAQPQRYREVVDEICRGIRMVVEFAVEPSPDVGWIRVACPIWGMSGWLVRAISMENISVHASEGAIELPAGPDYRLEKEIKNVITTIAKTCHYFVDHMWSGQQRDIAELFEKTEAKSPLIQPARLVDAFDADEMRALGSGAAEQILQTIGLPKNGAEYYGWLGIECPSIRAAVWMMRALAVKNVLARREDTVLYLPLNPSSDPNGAIVIRALAGVHRLAGARGVFA